ncbi:MAG: carboxypeptidase-like regulatory domain-containing protein [Blastocatellales bacterium]
MKKSKLDKLKVVSPCSASWDEMTGDERKRHCRQCDKTVFDFSRMSLSQIEAVVSAKHGQLCARITRRHDGSMVTLEPPLPAYASRRISPLVGATFATILSLSVPATANTAVIQQGRIAIQSDKSSEKNDNKKLGDGLAGMISGTISDQQGAVVPGAKITLIIKDGEALSTTSSAEGQYQFTGLAPGVYTLRVEASGFMVSIVTDVNVNADAPVILDVTIQVGEQVTMGGAVAISVSTLLNLYSDSDLIAIVTVGKSRIVSRDENSIEVVSALHPSAILKGSNGRRTIPLHHSIYDHGENENQIKTGDRLLVFLNQREEDGQRLDGYSTSSWSRATMKLNDNDLSVYRQRIEELNSILTTDQPNNAELIEWLVRCVEEPATRWDGVYELERSLATRLNSKPKSEDESNKENQSLEKTIKAVTGQNSLDQDKTEDVVEFQRLDTEAALADTLTDNQKARLANALFSIESLSDADNGLVNLVQKIGDKRLLPYLVYQLRIKANEAPRLAENLVSTIAELLDDEDVQDAADEYSENIEYDESEDEPEEGHGSSISKPKTVAAQIAIAQRFVLLSKFLAVVDRKLDP